jgi:hypothetical protein
VILTLVAEGTADPMPAWQEMLPTVLVVLSLLVIFGVLGMYLLKR